MRSIAGRRFSFLFILLAICLTSSARVSAQSVRSPEFYAALARQIDKGNTEQKRSALFEIRNLRDAEASRAALPALHDGDEIVRATAAAAVVFLPAAEAVPALAPLLSDKSEFVRREAAYALGETGSTLAAGPLLQALKDKSLEVRSAAAVSLGKTGEPTAVLPLVSLLGGRASEDNEFLRRSAARSIGQIAQIIKGGKRRVVTPQNFLPEPYKEIPPDPPGELADAFPQFAKAVQTLTTVLKSGKESEDTRREAAYALGSIGDPASVAVLTAQLGNADPYLAEIAREALRKIEAEKPAGH